MGIKIKTCNGEYMHNSISEMVNKFTSTYRSGSYNLTSLMTDITGKYFVCVFSSKGCYQVGVKKRLNNYKYQYEASIVFILLKGGRLYIDERNFYDIV